MSFRKVFILLELCSVGYFVYANPKLCLQTLHALPIAAKNVAADPTILFRLFPGHYAQPPPLVAAAESNVGEPPQEPALETESSEIGAPELQANEIPAAAAPPTKKMTDYDLKLAAAFAAGDSDSAGATASAAPTPLPVKQKTEVIQIVHQEATTRYLHLVVRESTLRFHVTNSMTNKDLTRVVESLKNACIKASAQDSTCGRQRSTVVVDQRFFSDMKQAEVTEWAPSGLPATGLVWRLACANGKDECLSSASRYKSFKLTEARANESELTLARGFESRVSKWPQRKPTRVPATAKSAAVQRAYVTQVTSGSTSLSDAGSL